MGTASNATLREPWNKSKMVGQKAPFKLKVKHHLESTGLVEPVIIKT